MRSNPSTRPGTMARLLAASVLAICLPAHALYKVVGPDGKVTYTDRIPGASEGKVMALGAAGSSSAEATDLPFELRQVVARYPVTLYAFADCSPCDSARAMLRQRGIPYVEKLVLTEQDATALQRLTGSREGPTLTIGQKPLPGFSAETWNAYLDSAGYPRDNRLPPGYQQPVATALTERAEPARAAPVQPRAPAAPSETATPPSTGIRF